jgi:hypothetical protein
VEDKKTSDVFVVFVIKKLVAPFDTHWFIVGSLPAKVAIYKCAILSPGCDLGISRFCSLLKLLCNSKIKL